MILVLGLLTLVAVSQAGHVKGGHQLGQEKLHQDDISSPLIVIPSAGDGKGWINEDQAASKIGSSDAIHHAQAAHQHKPNIVPVGVKTSDSVVLTPSVKTVTGNLGEAPIATAVDDRIIITSPQIKTQPIRKAPDSVFQQVSQKTIAPRESVLKFGTGSAGVLIPGKILVPPREESIPEIKLSSGDFGRRIKTPAAISVKEPSSAAQQHGGISLLRTPVRASILRQPINIPTQLIPTRGNVPVLSSADRHPEFVAGIEGGIESLSGLTDRREPDLRIIPELKVQKIDFRKDKVVLRPDIRKITGTESTGNMNFVLGNNELGARQSEFGVAVERPRVPVNMVERLQIDRQAYTGAGRLVHSAVHIPAIPQPFHTQDIRISPIAPSLASIKPEVVSFGEKVPTTFEQPGTAFEMSPEGKLVPVLDTESGLPSSTKTLPESTVLQSPRLTTARKPFPNIFTRTTPVRFQAPTPQLVSRAQLPIVRQPIPVQHVPHIPDINLPIAPQIHFGARSPPIVTPQLSIPQTRPLLKVKQQTSPGILAETPKDIAALNKVRISGIDGTAYGQVGQMFEMSPDGVPIPISGATKLGDGLKPALSIVPKMPPPPLTRTQTPFAIRDNFVTTPQRPILQTRPIFQTMPKKLPQRIAEKPRDITKVRISGIDGTAFGEVGQMFEMGPDGLPVPVSGTPQPIDGPKPPVSVISEIPFSPLRIQTPSVIRSEPNIILQRPIPQARPVLKITPQPSPQILAEKPRDKVRISGVGGTVLGQVGQMFEMSPDGIPIPVSGLSGERFKPAVTTVPEIPYSPIRTQTPSIITTGRNIIAQRPIPQSRPAVKITPQVLAERPRNIIAHDKVRISGVDGNVFGQVGQVFKMSPDGLPVPVSGAPRTIVGMKPAVSIVPKVPSYPIRRVQTPSIISSSPNIIAQRPIPQTRPALKITPQPPAQVLAEKPRGISELDKVRISGVDGTVFGQVGQLFEMSPDGTPVPVSGIPRPVEGLQPVAPIVPEIPFSPVRIQTPSVIRGAPNVIAQRPIPQARPVLKIAPKPAPQIFVEKPRDIATLDKVRISGIGGTAFGQVGQMFEMGPDSLPVPVSGVPKQVDGLNPPASIVSEIPFSPLRIQTPSVIRGGPNIIAQRPIPQTRPVLKITPQPSPQVLAERPRDIAALDKVRISGIDGTVFGQVGQMFEMSPDGTPVPISGAPKPIAPIIPNVRYTPNKILNPSIIRGGIAPQRLDLQARPVLQIPPQTALPVAPRIPYSPIRRTEIPSVIRSGPSTTPQRPIPQTRPVIKLTPQAAPQILTGKPLDISTRDKVRISGVDGTVFGQVGQMFEMSPDGVPVPVSEVSAPKDIPKIIPSRITGTEYQTRYRPAGLIIPDAQKPFSIQQNVRPVLQRPIESKRFQSGIETDSPVIQEHLGVSGPRIGTLDDKLQIKIDDIIDHDHPLPVQLVKPTIQKSAFHKVAEGVSQPISIFPEIQRDEQVQEKISQGDFSESLSQLPLAEPMTDSTESKDKMPVVQEQVLEQVVL